MRTDLDHRKALSALRRAGRMVDEDAFYAPNNWAALAATWESKRNKVNREALDYDAWAALLIELCGPWRCRVATRNNDSALIRLASHYDRAGASYSPRKGPTKRQKRSAAKEAAHRLAATAQRSGNVVALDAPTLLGDLLSDAAIKYVFLGDEIDVQPFSRVHLSKVAAALRPMGPVVASYDVEKAVLSLRWREGRGGLNLRPACLNAAELQYMAPEARLDVVFPVVRALAIAA